MAARIKEILKAISRPGVEIFLACVFLVLWPACSPKVIEHTTTKIEYRDRVVHDTATVEIPYEVEKIVTRDTMSHLENNFAKSDAKVEGGFLYHSLETKPQKIPVPVTIHVTDTLYKESEVITEIKEVKIEKPLSWWKRIQLDVFPWLFGAFVLLLLWVFRKPLIKLIKF